MRAVRQDPFQAPVIPLRKPPAYRPLHDSVCQTPFFVHIFSRGHEYGRDYQFVFSMHNDVADMSDIMPWTMVWVATKRIPIIFSAQETFPEKLYDQIGRLDYSMYGHTAMITYDVDPKADLEAVRGLGYYLESLVTHDLIKHGIASISTTSKPSIERAGQIRRVGLEIDKYTDIRTWICRMGMGVRRIADRYRRLSLGKVRPEEKMAALQEQEAIT